MEDRARFKRPVRAGRGMRMEWMAIGIEPARSGETARPDGRITDATDGKPALTAQTRCLFFG